MAKGVLVDLTKCVGCGSCTVACKLWNDLKWDPQNPTVGDKVKLNDKNWTVVGRHEVKDKDGTPVWRFVKQQCFHCKEPACASACFAKAFQKTKEGPVIYYPHLCVGCRYCMVACPFNIPKYQWEKTFPLVTKCQMCSTRVAKGEAPACVSVCPAGVFKYGDREALLKEAKSIVAKDPKYVNHIFGEQEVGGTSWLYLSDIPFEQLGFKTNVTHRPLPSFTEKYMQATPYVAITWGAILTGLYHYTKRRNQIAKENNKNIKA
ncbi:4Fe-4S ferredoxin iron-sulfur binding domain-containing protein [Desulfotomaculum nigrificans CO-1-SRB]|uniref:4Fe-4S ferredoxin iron-sulfur binding domain-containing protein n=1 Tax=Desulfotomaculum nigrificans (strain DSM 14880 / VKM B-2319 / CO-1-SRB) TaxID=868595 RepID=F6B4A5_DESCC|nr:4Fe-4S dicluster domain-containing protein [Desulfotomaculum nigrificans]AEF95282.1 4Fe-4S ferredoxin iron-sulfur binding domain-containing protein [Desulfotomaculum nigrificans CO-1-SRB]